MTRQEADARLLWWIQLFGVCIFGWVVAAVTVSFTVVLPAYRQQVFDLFMDPRMFLCPAVLWWVMGIPALFGGGTNNKKDAS